MGKDKIYTIQELMKLDENLLLEMATVSKSKIGLPYDLWLDPAGIDRGNEHVNNPRIKIKVDDSLIPIEISDDPKIPDSVKKNLDKDIPNLAAVKNYVKAYKKVLLAHYYKKIDDKDALNLLSTIGDAKAAELKLDEITKPKTNGEIRYKRDVDQCLYVISVFDDKNNIVTTSYAFNKYYLYSEIKALKDTYEITTVIDLDKK